MTSAGGKRPWRDDAGDRVQPGGELGRVADRAEVVGDHAAVGGAGDVAQGDVAERAQRGVEAVGEQLERDRGREMASTGLSDAADDDEAVGGGGDDLLARVRRAAALDQPAVRA